MKELAKNPNTRQPYSDVSGDLDRIVGNVVEFLGVAKSDYSDGDETNLNKYLRQLDQAILRARAVLDPTSLTDEEWTQAQIQPDTIK
jgi:hypothetical protein